MSYCSPVTSQNKWIASGLSALLFALLSSPFAYGLTDQLVKGMGLRTTEYSGCASVFGLVLHAVVYLLIVRLIMQYTTHCKSYASKDLWVASAMGAVLFLVIGSPYLYTVTASLGKSAGFDGLAEANGCANMGGLVLHSLVFLVVVRILMR